MATINYTTYTKAYHLKTKVSTNHQTSWWEWPCEESSGESALVRERGRWSVCKPSCKGLVHHRPKGSTLLHHPPRPSELKPQCPCRKLDIFHSTCASQKAEEPKPKVRTRKGKWMGDRRRRCRSRQSPARRRQTRTMKRLSERESSKAASANWIIFHLNHTN